MKLSVFFRALAVASLLTSLDAAAAERDPFETYGTGAIGSTPPVEVTWSLGSPLRAGTTQFGDLETLHIHAGYVQSFAVNDDLHWLGGVDWRRFSASVPAGAPVPNTLQSLAIVIGADWRFRDDWRVRLEALPGVYSDFNDFSGRDFNVPFAAFISYDLNPRLTIGAQINVDARRESPVVGIPGIRWRFANRWLLSLWIPRPQVEYQLADEWTLFAGGSFAGGTYVVAKDFGTRQGRAALDNQAVDFQEVRVGAGFRYTVAKKLALEVGGGWTIDRRYHFHERDLLLNGRGAPYVQCSFGLTF
ncbi:MAG: DUF6268 family outer membrane beta-barrel protein [Verrucomicrobiota bacterium]